MVPLLERNGLIPAPVPPVPPVSQLVFVSADVPELQNATLQWEVPLPFVVPPPPPEALDNGFVALVIPEVTVLFMVNGRSILCFFDNNDEYIASVCFRPVVGRPAGLGYVGCLVLFFVGTRLFVFFSENEDTTRTAAVVSAIQCGSVMTPVNFANIRSVGWTGDAGTGDRPVLSGGYVLYACLMPVDVRQGAL
jgi:hypothetical protein